MANSGLRMKNLGRIPHVTGVCTVMHTWTESRTSPQKHKRQDENKAAAMSFRHRRLSGQVYLRVDSIGLSCLPSSVVSHWKLAA